MSQQHDRLDLLEWLMSGHGDDFVRVLRPELIPLSPQPGACRGDLERWAQASPALTEEEPQ